MFQRASTAALWFYLGYLIFFLPYCIILLAAACAVLSGTIGELSALRKKTKTAKNRHSQTQEKTAEKQTQE
jgi:TRAP-type mannitol/chloroaromatic compound transport system permease small subunit